MNETALKRLARRMQRRARLEKLVAALRSEFASRISDEERVEIRAALIDLLATVGFAVIDGTLTPGELLRILDSLRRTVAVLEQALGTRENLPADGP